MNSIAHHIIDLVNNSIRARASQIQVDVCRDSGTGFLELCIQDNGIGMSEEVRLKALDPFFTTRKSRKLGFGLPFIRMSAEQSGGSFELHSQSGQGCRLIARFNTNSIDMLPLGDLPSALTQLLCSHPDIRISFTWQDDQETFSVSTTELLAVFEEIPISHVKSMNMIRAYINDNLETNKITEVHQ